MTLATTTRLTDGKTYRFTLCSASPCRTDESGQWPKSYHEINLDGEIVETDSIKGAMLKKIQDQDLYRAGAKIEATLEMYDDKESGQERKCWTVAAWGGSGPAVSDAPAAAPQQSSAATAAKTPPLLKATAGDIVDVCFSYAAKRWDAGGRTMVPGLVALVRAGYQLAPSPERARSLIKSLEAVNTEQGLTRWQMKHGWEFGRISSKYRAELEAALKAQFVKVKGQDEQEEAAEEGGDDGIPF